MFPNVFAVKNPLRIIFAALQSVFLYLLISGYRRCSKDPTDSHQLNQVPVNLVLSYLFSFCP